MAALLSQKMSVSCLQLRPSSAHTPCVVQPIRPTPPAIPLSLHTGLSCRQEKAQIAVRGIPVSGPQPGKEPSAMNAAPPGQIAASLIASMQEKISKELETDRVTIADAYGDGRHVSIDVVSPLFEGQNAVKRQRMVYKAIWLELQEAVHAVDAMTTKTPAEAGQ